MLYKLTLEFGGPADQDLLCRINDLPENEDEKYLVGAYGLTQAIVYFPGFRSDLTEDEIKWFLAIYWAAGFNLPVTVGEG